MTDFTVIREALDMGYDPLSEAHFVLLRVEAELADKNRLAVEAQVARGEADLVAPTRDLLKQTGLPYVIENVPGSPVVGSLMLCGSSFNLGSNGRYLRRHRYFELNWPLHTLVPPCDHRKKGAILVAGHTSMMTHKPSGQPRSYQGSKDERAEAMGIDWMTTGEIAEAIPPAYTEFIGAQLLAHLSQAVAA